MTLSNEEMPPSHPDLIGLSVFVEGRLPDDERREWVTHLSKCAECRAILATLARGGDGLHAHRATTARGLGFRHTIAWLPIAATLVMATIAGVAVWRANSANVTPAVPSVTPVLPPLPPAPATISPQPPGAAPPPAGVSKPPLDPSLTVRRSGGRVVEGKTFRLVAGEWIDAAYDPLAVLPVEIIEGAATRSSTLVRVPALKPFAALGARVTVVHDGVVYRFR